MKQAQVTFVRHNPRQATARTGPNAGGQFTVHEFFTADDLKFDTTKAEIANVAYALLNQPVTVTYEETQNGQYTNRKLQAVQAAGADGAPMAPGVLPNAAAAAPSAPTSAPAPQQSSGTRMPDSPETAGRIARSVGLEQALKAVELGICQVSTVDELFNVAAGFAVYVFKGSRPSSPAATGADSSGAGGGGDAGAAPAAPAPTSAPEAAPAADDDIPF